MDDEKVALVENKMRELLRGHAPGASSLAMHVCGLRRSDECMGVVILRMVESGEGVGDAAAQRLLVNFKKFVARQKQES